MARRFSLADAAACVAAGVGAWFTRAALDVFAVPGGEARVAMLPALVELTGLAALALLSAFLLRRILSRGRPVPTSPSPARTSPPVPDLLLPFLSVLAIAVPYAPLFPDLVPAWRALAGPARFALWCAVCGQVAWIAADAALRPAVSDEGRGRGTGAGWWTRDSGVAILVLLVSCAAGLALARSGTADAFGHAGMSHARGFPLGLRVPLGAIVSAWLWLWAVRVTGSRAAATVAWLAVAGAAPFFLGGILAPTPSVAAACVVVAAGWPARDDDPRGWAAAIRGTAVAALLWLDASYVPLALVLAACLAWRMRRARGPLVAAVAPLVLAALARLALDPHAWRVLADVHREPWWSAAALLLGQQDGVLLYAPALALAAPGLWGSWRDGGTRRVAAIEAVLGLAAVLLMAGSHDGRADALAVPGAALVPALPLLVGPIALWVRRSGPAVARIALARLLVLWGLIVSASLLLAPGGVVVRGRDGASGLLGWLAPSGDLVRAAPIAPPAGADPVAFLVATLIWLAVAAGLSWVVGRARTASHGGAAVIVTIAVLAALTAGAAAVEGTLGPRLPARVAPGLRTDAPMLDGFDARRRPLAIAYDGWRTLPAAGVPPLFAFDATPGARRHPQPMRVLLNTRLSLPAGDYVITVRPSPGAGLNGNAGLQVGRTGPPLRTWQLATAPGAPWTGRFTLPVDASFVGLRTTPEFAAAVAALRVQPVRVVNGRDRHHLPTVLSSATYKDVIVTFHGDQVYAERDGFWVRGRSTLLATFAPPEAPGREPGVRLSLHGGATATRVRFETATWGTTVALEPGVSRELHVPALQGQTLLPVRITAESGFVPADTDGGTDRRLLGCWIEVLR